MADRIEFPYNDEMYYKQASAFLETKEYDKALDAIKKVYENDQSPAVTNLYVVILYEMEEYEEALEIADQHKDFYLENENYTISYVSLLIKNRIFIEAEAIIQDHLNHTYSPYYPVWEQLNNEFKVERENYIIKIEQQKKETKASLLKLEMYSPFKQNEIIDRSRDLDLEDLQEAASNIFRNPYLGGLPQRAFLEVLIEKNDDTAYPFSWFNQQRTIIPSQLMAFEQDPIFRETQSVLKERLEKYPDLYEPIFTEILNDLLLLYPFIEETVTDVDYWVNCYLAKFDYTNQLNVEIEPKTENQEELRAIFEKMNQTP